MNKSGDQLLKKAFDIMSHNDPKQPLLTQIAAYLKAEGYVLEEVKLVDDTRRFMLDTGNPDYNYQIEVVGGKEVGLRAALGLGPTDPLPVTIIEIDGKPVGQFTHT